MSALLDGFGVAFAGPAFSLTADGRVFTDSTMTPTGELSWADGDVRVRLTVGTAADGSRDVTLTAEGVRHVSEVCLLDATLDPAPAELHNHRWYDFFGLQRSTAVFARFGDGGVFACYANPFGDAEIDGNRLRLFYRPAMDVDGSFRSDPLVVGRFRNEGRAIVREMLPGRDVVAGKVPGYGAHLGPVPSALDAGESRAVRSAVAARIPWEPQRARVSHWDWGENLFRVVMDDPSHDGVAMYRRAMQLCAEIGVETILLAPATAERPWDVDGPWQHIMWLSMGMDVEHGRWKPGDEPPVVRALLESARDHDLDVVSYSNPQILWDRISAHSVTHDMESPGYTWACMGAPEVRERMIRTYLDFADAYDLRGFSLDFVYWAACSATTHGHEPGEASRYAMWDGYRQLLAALAQRPDHWTETLIGSQLLLPWGARDMTHPHPVLGDNQPQWVPAWPDLSQDRANANFQRRTAYWMRNFAFTPTYKLPGQVSHQANRIHDWPVERGWDWEGARYNLLSSIASAPSSTIVCFLPAWDEKEWAGMRARDVAFFRRWIRFAKEHAEVLARMEDLFDEPRPGTVDGTIVRDPDGGGFVFLTNPDYGPLTARVPLSDGELLEEVHPQERRLWAADVTVDPHQVAVLRIVGRDDVSRHAVTGIAGAVDERGELVEAIGTPGTVASAQVVGTDQVLTVHFATDGITPELGPWHVDDRTVEPAACSGDVVARAAWVPGAALPGLLEALAPPVRPEGDELLQPWSDPSRLRLYIDLVDPQSVTPRVRVDGHEETVAQAWIGTWPDVKDPHMAKLEHNLLGHYVDLTHRLDGDLERPWNIEVLLDGLEAGQWRGVHVAHLPRRLTSEFTVEPS